MAIWVLQAAIVLIFCVVVPFGMAKQPYCEHCERWTASFKVVLPGLDHSAASPFLASGDLDGLLNLSPMSQSQLGVQSAWLRVAQARVELNRNRDAKVTRKKIVTDALLTPVQRALFIRRSATNVRPVAAPSVI
jgi:hypothetical protein